MKTRNLVLSLFAAVAVAACGETTGPLDVERVAPAPALESGASLNPDSAGVNRGESWQGSAG